ncbi:MAG: ThiF family adenylyltransferase [archaeon]
MQRRTFKQTYIPGWEQGILDAALLVNLGQGLPLRYASLFAACLEIGRIVHAGDEVTQGNDAFMGRAIDSGQTPSQIEQILHSLNPDVSIKGFYPGVKSDALKEIVMHASPVFFHAGNSSKEKRMMLSQWVYMHSESKPNVSLSAGNEHEIRIASYHGGKILNEHLMPQFEGQRSSRIMSIAQATIGLGEIISNLLELGNPQKDIITWNLWSRKRTSYVNDFDWRDFDPRNKTIGLVGVGAVGVSFLEATDGLGFEKIYMFDDDTAEFTNTSRAPQFANYLGRLKSLAMADYYNARNNGTLYIGSKRRISESSRLPDVDLLICAADGFDNQMRIINLSQRKQLSMLLAGCTPFTLNVNAYVPGMTSSMLFQNDFLELAYLSAIRQEHRHCTDPEVEGSQVLTTALAGAVLAGEAINYFACEPLRGPFYYDMLGYPRLQYFPISGIRDLGVDIPRFQPPLPDTVTRDFEQGVEQISVCGKPFDDWYHSVGNVFEVGKNV